MPTTLITGGAGFIGSHLADALLARGRRVRVLDSLEPQVHGAGPGGSLRRPDYLDGRVDLIVGDVTDARKCREALRGVDTVYHFAARVGVGQSMYRIADYASTNQHGTGVLLEAMQDASVERLVVASSMSIYGEGRYLDPSGRPAAVCERARRQLERGDWELRDGDGTLLEPVPTAEDKTPCLSSIYALTKYDQERMCLLYGQAYNVPTVALRFFNVYGPRQALSNPYTGVLAIFASRLMNGRPPLIFEDGLQRRDFVSVHDVVRACVLAGESARAVGHAINVGSGRSHTVREIAELVAEAMGRRDVAPEITGKYRVGDIRHCFADIALARDLLGYEPEVDLPDGLRELAVWLRGQTAEDRVDDAARELTERGLTV